MPRLFMPLYMILAVIATGLLTSCTAGQVYQNIQQDHQRQCRHLPIWQQDHCLSLNDTPWEEYAREREGQEAY